MSRLAPVCCLSRCPCRRTGPAILIALDPEPVGAEPASDPLESVVSHPELVRRPVLEAQRRLHPLIETAVVAVFLQGHDDREVKKGNSGCRPPRRPMGSFSAEPYPFPGEFNDRGVPLFEGRRELRDSC